MIGDVEIGGGMGLKRGTICEMRFENGSRDGALAGVWGAGPPQCRKIDVNNKKANTTKKTALGNGIESF